MSRIQRPYAHWNSSTLQVAAITSEAAQTHRDTDVLNRCWYWKEKKKVQQLAWGSLKFRLFYAEPVRNYAWNEDEAQLRECVYMLYSNLQDLSNEISPFLVGIVLIML